MSSVVISGDTSGSITLAAPAVSGSNTATLPAATGTVMVTGNMPAFSAYQSASAQSISNATFTKVTFDAEEFDTNNNFASSRFTPTIAGYYQLSATVLFGGAGLGSSTYLSFFKNGSEFKRGNGMFTSSSINPSPNSTVLVYANGTSDYFEVYLSQATGSSVSLNNNSSYTWFTGAMVRSA